MHRAGPGDRRSSRRMPRHLIDAGLRRLHPPPGGHARGAAGLRRPPLRQRRAGGRRRDGAATRAAAPPRDPGRPPHPHPAGLLTATRSRPCSAASSGGWGWPASTNMGEYARLLRQSPAEVTALADDLLIHVTGFLPRPRGVGGAAAARDRPAGRRPRADADRSAAG